MNFSVTQNGRPLDSSLYDWNEETRTFSTNKNDLVLDFSNISGVTFKTGYGCTFNTEYNCTFNTEYNCTFKTGYGCTFDTGSYCTFDTGSYCTFKTGSNCAFDTGPDCVVVRRDVFEVIILNEDENHIKLNEHRIKGYEVIEEKKTIIINGLKFELNKEQLRNLKEQLNN